MSVLKSLKGTLQSVQHGVSASFKRLSSTGDKKIELEADTVNLDAGADILNRFQQYWIELHQKSEENAKRAEEIDSQISSIYLSCEGKADALNALNSELEHIPELIQHLESITTSIALINSQCEDTEKMLTEFENQMEEQEMIVNKKSHHYQLSTYTERKLAELNTFRVQMAEQHAQRVKEHEEKKLAALHERQQAFEEAFTQDLEHYRLYGSSPRQPSISSVELDVGEIKIDDDEKALDDFLQSTEDGPDETVPESEVFELDDDEGAMPTVAVATDEDIDTSVVQELKSETKDRTLDEGDETKQSDVEQEESKDAGDKE